MKRVIAILVLACICIGVYTQTPYDSFAPGTSRPILDMGTVVSNFYEEHVFDTSLNVAVIDTSFTDDICKWMSVDPLADKYPNISPYAYCGWNPVNRIDPDGKLWETAWDIANVGMDIQSLRSNVSNGNVSGALLDGAGLVLDVSASILPVVPGGAGTAIKAYRAADKVSDAGRLGKSIDKVITATKNTYRQVLQKVTGKLGKGYEAHHTLPQKHRRDFEKLGINIDEPGNVVWRKTEGHRAKNAEHGKEWDKFFDQNPSPTKEQVIEFRDKTEQKVWGNMGDSPLQ